MNVIQTCTNPVRIRIEDETNAGSGGGNTGQDFSLEAIGEQYAVFIKVENSSEPPQSG